MEHPVEVLGRDPHRIVLEGVVEPIVEQRVMPVISIECLLAGSWRKSRRSRHAFDAARNRHARVAEQHGRLGEPNRLEAGTADLIHGHRRAVDRQPGIDLDLPRDILPQSGRQDVAQNHLIDAFGDNMIAFKRRRHQPGRHIHGVDIA